MTEIQQNFYSVPEFAKKVGAHSGTIRRWIKEGALKAVKPYSSEKAHWRIPHSEYIRLINEKYGDQK